LSVQNNQLEGAETLVININDVTDADGNTIELKDSLSIGISKNETRYNYPLYYEQDFNFAPKEAYVKSSIFS